MGFTSDYPDVPDWEPKDTGYTTGDMVKYKGNIFYANFWASEPGQGTPDTNGWRFYDELYDQTPHTPTGQAKIIGYIPSWRKGEGFDYANDELYRYITHGIVAFLMFSEETLGEFDSKSLSDIEPILSDIVQTGHRNDAKILIALGGANDYGFLNLMQRIGGNASDPLLDSTVRKVVDFVNVNSLDGVDLDLECWWDKRGNPVNDQGGRLEQDSAHVAGYGLAEFAKKLREAMPDKIISAAFFATSWYGNNYPLIDSLDWIGVMTYDLTGSWDNSPVGPHTALYKIRNLEDYVEEQQGDWPQSNPDRQSDDPMGDNPILSVEDSLWYWTNPFFVNWQGSGQNLPRNKMAAGVPLYGYDFSYAKDRDDQSNLIPPGYKVIRYKDILSQFSNAHNEAGANIKREGSTTRPSFREAEPGEYQYRHNIYYETPATAVEKLNFLKQVGAQGVIIWELSNEVWEDGKSIVKALYEHSGNPPKSDPTVLIPDYDPQQHSYYAALDFDFIKEEFDDDLSSVEGGYVRAQVIFYSDKERSNAIADYQVGFDPGWIDVRHHIELRRSLAGRAVFVVDIEQMKRENWQLSVKVHTDEDLFDKWVETLFGGVGRHFPTADRIDTFSSAHELSQEEIKHLPRNVVVIDFRGKESELLGKATFVIPEQFRENYLPRIKRVRGDDEEFRRFGNPE